MQMDLKKLEITLGMHRLWEVEIVHAFYTLVIILDIQGGPKNNTESMSNIHNK